MSILFGRLRAAALTVNTPMCSFGLKQIPYLGYVITQEGIKSDPNKVQEIMDPGIPTTLTEAEVQIGMIEYYRYMWPRRYQILDPLTEATSAHKG